MYLSERNPKLRSEASRTVCDFWAQVGNLGFAAERSDIVFHGGQEGGSGSSNLQAWAPGQPEDSKSGTSFRGKKDR